jgi:hypothetical protein
MARTSTDINWHDAGQRDWDLSVITGVHSDDEPEHAAAAHERELIRDHIPHLTETQLRDYLEGLLDQMEIFFWQGI